ncbi:unnamed protein product [Echinostoma caproni]|uniref:Myosin motor domain-containing protein n=1 Tax=Echinostoma caproni TaxID=27848 RepID=A0A183AFI4_9TREM|nr:unnamed protein product [Echinostoma caproni]
MDAFRLLYASHVRPRLEYGGAATYPCTTGELAKLERVQRAATRLVVGLRGTSYVCRLQATGLFPIAYRRLRGDIICLRKILNVIWARSCNSTSLYGQSSIVGDA